MASKDSFTTASSDPRWYEGLKMRTGSCLDLYNLLETNRGLIHELGPNRKTVLHKGVHHGCVKLVKFVLVDMFDEDGICKCKGEDNDHCGLTREELLRKTDKRGDTAVNTVLVSGSPKIVKLLAWAIRVSKCDRSNDLPSDRDESDDEGDSPEKSSTISYVNAPDVDDEVFIENEWAPIIYKSDYEIKYGSDFMNHEMYDKVYEKIDEAMGECGEWMNDVKAKIEGDVNYQFVPIKQIIVHYLFSVKMMHDLLILGSYECELIAKEIIEFVWRIVKKCTSNEGPGGCNGDTDDRMIVTLFNILDPQGRTILHALPWEHLSSYFTFRFNNLGEILLNDDMPLLEGTIDRFSRARDGAGRSVGQIMELYKYDFIMICGLYWRRFRKEWFGGENQRRMDKSLVTNWYENSGIHILHCWCFGNNPCVHQKAWGQLYASITPLHMAIIFDNEEMFECLMEFVDPNKELLFSCTIFGDEVISPFHLASILGRTTMVESFLKHYAKFKNVKDGGFGNHSFKCYAAIHYAAMCGRSETVQMILRYSIYDPICQTHNGTALHAIVGMDIQSSRNLVQYNNGYDLLEMIKEIALHYAVPSSSLYKHIQKDFLILDVIGNVPRMFTDDEKTCINLLIQGGIDVWTMHQWKVGEVFPSVNEKGNNEARAWWFEKVVKEVEIKKASITSAANATSLIGALVATTSFIGPLQPPSSYGVDGDYIHMSRKAIQVYLVCNNFSFFFSIASILMAVLPAIPMSKESLYDEMLRSERCLKTAVAFLLVSIICIIASFSSASIAVVSPQWHDRKFVVISIALGVLLCLFVLAIHIIRLLRMVFHKSNWLRRRFARHMYF